LAKVEELNIQHLKSNCNNNLKRRTKSRYSLQNEHHDNKLNEKIQFELCNESRKSFAVCLGNDKNIKSWYELDAEKSFSSEMLQNEGCKLAVEHFEKLMGKRKEIRETMKMQLRK
jgi:hypothetical protein